MRFLRVLFFCTFFAAFAGHAEPTTSAIVNGHSAASGAYPWMVSIHVNGYDASSPKGGHFCGGSLIHPEFVLTAAHCMAEVPATPGFLAVTLGRNKLSEVGSGVTVPVSSIILNPLFDRATFSHDAALLHLSKPVVVSPVALDFTGSALLGGAPATIMGWGVTSEDSHVPSDQLQEAEIAIQTDYTCALDLGLAYSSASMLCAGKLATSPSSKDGVDSCFGDSGGPLLVKDLGGVVRQAGVTSWGYGCASSKYYGVWSRVAALAPWIAANVPLEPVVRAAPVVQGLPIVGQLLGCEGAVFDGAGLSTSYLWEDSTGSKLSSVANDSYLPMSGDVGKTVRCTVTVTTPSGATASASSLWIGPISGVTANKDIKAPVVKKLRVRCKKGQCTVSVQVSDPAPSASGVRSVELQATWNRTSCSIVNKRRFCVSKSEKLSPVYSSQDKSYRYYNLAVPGRGKATIEVLATDNRGNISTKKTYKVSVS